MDMMLKNKFAVITGGAGGIGSATAHLFLQQGAAGILLTDLKLESLEEVKKQLNSDKVHLAVVDVTHGNEVKSSLEKAMEIFGRIDVLFLNAGYEGKVASIADYAEEEFDRIMNINVKGVFWGLKYGMPLMNGGSIIITSSVAGLKGTALAGIYTTSKHAVIGMMRSAALEGAPKGVRVNTVHPGPIDNRMMRSLEEGFAPGAGAEVKKGFEAMIPLQRYGSNEDIAQAVLFLASDMSSYVTGSRYVVDGGMTA
jgi:NAD(P)-dependent dehydrogenase (short-subunit alcohol dehydrogenase family)